VTEKEAGMGQPREVEVALVVCSATPLAVRERLAGLGSLPGFGLVGRPALAIGDTYVDTRDRDLAARGIALRVRTVAGAAFLTCKAEVRRTAAGAERMELEGAWSRATLDRVLAELAARGVELPGPAGSGTRPLETLLGMGLEAVQDRATERLPRDVVPDGGGPGDPVAELAVDAVVYRLPGRQVRLHEVEVEAKGAGDLATVAAVAERLRERFGAALRPWPHGKLATGQAVAALAAAGHLDGLLDPDGTLRPLAYEVLAAQLAAGPAG
jgi:inorganic triphosphatase YgiF